MGTVTDIASFRARRAAVRDVPIGSRPFVLEEPCPGCGAQRVSTMVWRDLRANGRPVPFPRIAPHFFCSEGRVVWQEIIDAPLRVSAWSSILGHFEERGDRRQVTGNNNPPR